MPFLLAIALLFSALGTSASGCCIVDTLLPEAETTTSTSGCCAETAPLLDPAATQCTHLACSADHEPAPLVPQHALQSSSVVLFLTQPPVDHHLSKLACGWIPLASVQPPVLSSQDTFKRHCSYRC